MTIKPYSTWWHIPYNNKINKLQQQCNQFKWRFFFCSMYHTYNAQLFGWTKQFVICAIHTKKTAPKSDEAQQQQQKTEPMNNTENKMPCLHNIFITFATMHNTNCECATTTTSTNLGKGGKKKAMNRGGKEEREREGPQNLLWAIWNMPTH